MATANTVATADSSQVTIRAVRETEWGSTPATPAMSVIPFTNESLNNNANFITSNTIRGDRQVDDSVKVSETNSGELGFELQYGSVWDGLFEAALQGTWASDKLMNGTSVYSYTIEKEFGGITGDKVEIYRGAVITNMTVNIAVGEMITGSFGLMAKSHADATASIADTVVAAPTNPKMNAIDEDTALEVDDVEVGYVQNMTFTLENNAREQRAIGSADLAGVGFGTVNVTGTMTTFFKGTSAINTAYKTQTPVKLAFKAVDSLGNAYKFTFPKVKLTGRTRVAGGNNQDVVLEVPFTAVIGGTDSKTVIIERIPAV